MDVVVLGRGGANGGTGRGSTGSGPCWVQARRADWALGGGRWRRRYVHWSCGVRGRTRTRARARWGRSTCAPCAVQTSSVTVPTDPLSRRDSVRPERLSPVGRPSPSRGANGSRAATRRESFGRSSEGGHWHAGPGSGQHATKSPPPQVFAVTHPFAHRSPASSKQPGRHRFMVSMETQVSPAGQADSLAPEEPHASASDA